MGNLAGCGNAAGGAATKTAGLISRDVFSASDVLTGARFVTGDLLGTAHLITGYAVAMAGGTDAHLIGLATSGFSLAEGLENFSSQVFSAGDVAAGGRLIASGFN